MSTSERAVMLTTVDDEPSVAADAADDVRRCFGCRRLWPRAAMRWGTVHAGPVWYPRSVRVLRCEECLAA